MWKFLLDIQCNLSNGHLSSEVTSILQLQKQVKIDICTAIGLLNA